MASGGAGRGAGRGLNIFQQKKKEEEEKKEEPPQLQQQPQVQEEEKKQPPLAGAEKPKMSFGRGGFLTSMLESKIAKRLSPETTQTEAVVEQRATVPEGRKLSEPTATVQPPAEQPIRKVSDTAEPQQKPTTGVQAIPPTLKPLGRGFKTSTTAAPVASTITSAPTVVPPPPITQQRISPRISPTKVSETAPTVQRIEELKVAEAPKAPEKKSSQGTKSDTSTGKSQFASDISHKTMEKALEELKVEEIKRTSPVQKLGTSGTPSNLSANYIKLKCKNAGIYQYIVYFDPPVESRQNRMRMVHSLKDVIGTVRLFDGMTLFLPIMLRDTVTVATSKRPTDQEETTIRIQLTKILPPEQIPPVVFNIIFRNIMNELKMKQIGQHYYNPSQHIRIPNHHLDVWPGYITAVREYEDGLYLVADVAHKVIRAETCLSLLEMLNERYRDLATFKQESINALVGAVVLTPYNNRTYRIDDILWELNPLSEFVYHNGEQCSYQKYYKDHYGITIRDLHQPLLLNRVKKPKAASPTQQHEMICLVPELCNLTGLTDEIRKDFRVMKELANHTRVTPQQRYESLKIFIETIRQTPNAIRHINNWGLELHDDTVDVAGRLLKQEDIVMARDTFPSGPNCDWNRDVTRKHVLSAVDLKSWMIVFTRNNARIAEKFAEACYGCSRHMGININEPFVVQVNDDRAETFVREIKNNLTEHTQLVLIIFPTSRDDRYAAVKRLCCIECPVPSQVVISKTISDEKKLSSVAQKIILQMNCKLGGELWRLNIPVNRLMVVGIDVYHQTEKKYKSLAGFVSSLNNEQTRWYSKVCFQMVGQELVDSMKVAFTQAIKKYQEVNGFLPEKILIFRDGVSDGQLNQVSEHEVEQLKSCFSFAPNYTPKLGVCVVQKRISARIFSQTSDHGRQFSNPGPGTIVDHGITRKDLYDFFLVSQHVRQGTVTPTHYIVVYDDTQFQPDHMQRISYKLTHLYYNWPGTIRVPAPCQYAHKLAFLTGQFLQKDPDPLLCNRLFYL